MTSPSALPLQLATWAFARRYGVPRSMIERSAEAREAGDWRAACAASNVDVSVDLREIARGYGSGVADRLEDDLRFLAPDLARWHLPRAMFDDTGLLSPDQTFALASYGPSPDRGPFLMVSSPAALSGAQRLSLEFGEMPTAEKANSMRRQWWTTSRHLWDSRHTDELRARCGGGDRAPFFTRDGRPRDESELPAGPAPDDPATHTEWLTTRYDAVARANDPEALVDVFAAAGLALDLHPRGEIVMQLGSYPLAVSRLAAEAFALRAVSPRWINPSHWLPRVLLDVSDPTVVRVQIREVAPPTRGQRVEFIEVLPVSSWRRLPDLDLLRAGRITPDALHPLVCQALFPDWPGPRAAGPPPPPEPEVIRVRCGGKWHEVRTSGGQLRLVHTAAEEQREAAIAMLGGRSTGCFAAKRAWVTGIGRLPRRLRAQRQDLFWRARHGDSYGVLALLDTGMDPAVRDGQRRTLLHMLPFVDHDVLLPRLLAAGLDLEARDETGRTPLHAAIGDRAPAALVRALATAGADTNAVDGSGRSLEHLIHKSGRDDLSFLRGEAP